MTINPEKKAKSQRMKWLDKHTLKGLLIYKKTFLIYKKQLKKIKTESQAEIIRREMEKDDIFPKDKIVSVQDKLKNFQHLNPEDKRKGYDHPSAADIKAWDDYKDTSIEDLEKIVKSLADKA